MPASVEAALRHALMPVPRKGVSSELNGEFDCQVDSSLIGANKLAELTRHRIDYEPAENNQANTLDSLKSKYVVLNTETVNKLNIMNNHPNFNGRTSTGIANGIGNGISNGLVNGAVNGASNGASNGSMKCSSSNGISCGSTNGNGNVNGNGHKVQDVLPTPKHVLYPPEKVILGWKEFMSSRGLTPATMKAGAGMVNVGNTCYLNATLQALFHVPALVQWLLTDSDHLRKCEQINGLPYGDCITCSMAKTLKMSQSNPIIKPSLIINKIRMICRHMGDNTQEDAHEFMRYLLENMEKAYLNRSKNLKLETYSKETTPINQIFGGYMRTEVRCLSCDTISTTFQHFQDLILDIRKASKVEEALDLYFAREKLDGGENAYKCERCKQMVAATKKFSIEKPPKVLCIQLKRFNMMGGKMSKHVEHRQIMDLKKYVSPKSQFTKGSPLVYRLIAMVVHSGAGASCGHYTAIAQCASGTYHHFDDTQVRSIQLPQVLNTHAYILIYEMEPSQNGFIKNTQKSATITSLGATGSVRNNHSNINHVNGINRLGSHNVGVLPAMKDRDHVAFGVTSPKLITVQPRIIMHSKRSDVSPVVPSALPVNNGSANGDSRPPNFIGPILLTSAKQSSSSMPSLTSPVKFSNGNSQNIETRPTKAEKKLSGSLVPYECDDDSSRESSLSPPLDEKPAVRSVTLTATNSWQVTPDPRSPSMNSESSNHSVASTTASTWNVTEKTKHGVKNIRDKNVKDCEEKGSDNAGDKELDDRVVKSRGDHSSQVGSVDGGNSSKRVCRVFGYCRKLLKSRETWKSLVSISANMEENPNGETKQEKEPSTEGSVKVTISGNEENSCPKINRIQQQTTVDTGSAHSNSPSSTGALNGTSTFSDSSAKGDKDRKNDAVGDLLKLSHRGYGTDVRTWNGERTQVEREVEEERQEQRKRPLDEYDDELDRGRVKKVKRDNRDSWPPHNPFQKHQNYQKHQSQSHHHQPWKNNHSYHNNRGGHYKKNYQGGQRHKGQSIHRDLTHSSSNKFYFKRHYRR